VPSLKLIALALQAASLPSFGFQDFELGSPIEQFRARSLSAGQYGPRRPMCSDGPGAPNWLRPQAHFAAAGQIKCGFEQRIGGGWVREGLPLSPEHQATLEFNYFEGLLYQIELFADVEAATSIRNGLTARFGQPRGAVTGTVQNTYGAQFPQAFTTWTRGRYSVTMIVPALTLRRMAVIYTDTEAEARIETIAQRHNRANM